jgi:hypothetical protein
LIGVGAGGGGGVEHGQGPLQAAVVVARQLADHEGLVVGPILRPAIADHPETWLPPV